MKKHALKIIVGILLFIVIALFFNPQKVVYQAKINGIVMDENGNPLNGATISRIEEKRGKNKESGYIEHLKYKTEIIKTNENGHFELKHKSRIEWFHPPFVLPLVWCYADFEISKPGFETYKTKFGEFKSYKKENCYACEKIEFNPKIRLEKNIR